MEEAEVLLVIPPGKAVAFSFTNNLTSLYSFQDAEQTVLLIKQSMGKLISATSLCSPQPCQALIFIG